MLQADSFVLFQTMVKSNNNSLLVIIVTVCIRNEYEHLI